MMSESSKNLISITFPTIISFVCVGGGVGGGDLVMVHYAASETVE